VAERDRLELIDTHAHTNFDAFDGDRAEVYARAREAGVVTLIEVGVGLEGSRAAVARAAAEPMVRAAVGLHPTDLDTFGTDWTPFEELVRTTDVTAIGECGLDYYWMKAEKPRQAEAFRRQIDLARRMSLPFIVHCRDAEEDLIGILGEERYERGVVHCFGGTAEQARRIVDLGLMISFCGNVTFPKNTQAQAAARAVPADRLMLETDSPFLSPVPKRGKRNEPAHVAHTARFLAELRGVMLADLAETTTRNARTFFDLKPDGPGTIAYRIGEILYVNITRLCTAHCYFCPRERGTREAWGHDLRLARDPTPEEILDAVAEHAGCREIVYCGLGEPTIRLAHLLTTARALKAKGHRIRVNTNGHGNLIHGRDVTPELAGIVDAVSISLDAQDAETYARVVGSTFGERAWAAVIEFARLAKRHVPEVTLTVVDGARGVDVEACRRIADDLGVGFRTRPLDDLKQDRSGRGS